MVAPDLVEIDLGDDVGIEVEEAVARDDLRHQQLEEV